MASSTFDKKDAKRWVTEPPPGVTVRRATLADYQGVMGISQGLCDGLDYLPDLYPEYARDPNRHMFLAKEKGGDVVSTRLNILGITAIRI